jgi:hypothetical protein
MTDDQIILLNYKHYASLFPKTCPKCRRVFETLRDYILATTPVGPTISYDVEMNDWRPPTPLGAAALANCPCGTTLGLTTEGIPLDDIHAMLEWIKCETESRGVSAEQLLGYLRDEVRKMALAGGPK